MQLRVRSVAGIIDGAPKHRRVGRRIGIGDSEYNQKEGRGGDRGTQYRWSYKGFPFKKYVASAVAVIVPRTAMHVKATQARRRIFLVDPRTVRSPSA
jgi:hypothetical protein